MNKTKIWKNNLIILCLSKSLLNFFSDTSIRFLSLSYFCQIDFNVIHTCTIKERGRESEWVGKIKNYLKWIIESKMCEILIVIVKMPLSLNVFWMKVRNERGK